jgi:hypothetical protein
MEFSNMEKHKEIQTPKAVFLRTSEQETSTKQKKLKEKETGKRQRFRITSIDLEADLMWNISYRNS